MTEDTIPREDKHRMPVWQLAIEQSTADWYEMVKRSYWFREWWLVAVDRINEQGRQIVSLQRQLEAIKDEYRAHRERTMRASLMHCTSKPAPRTYATKHGGSPGKFPNDSTGPQRGADA